MSRSALVVVLKFNRKQVYCQLDLSKCKLTIWQGEQDLGRFRCQDV